MSHIVTATIQPIKKLRVERVAPKKELEVPSGFSTKDGRPLGFKNPLGEELEALIIKGTSTFDLDNPIDKHNWNTLKIFCMLNKEYGRDVLFIDKEDETSKMIEFADRVYEVETYLRDHKHDYVLMQKIYRRVKGLVEGMTEATVFRSLIDLAKAEPDLFIKNGQMIVDHQDFEMKALVDISIERGNLLSDHDGTIKNSDGTIYAKDHEKAAYQLKLDDKTRIYLQRALDQKKEVTSVKYNFEEEDSELAVLLGQVGMTGEGLLDENRMKSDEVIMDSEDEIEINISAFVSAGFIERTGSGPATRYILVGISDFEFKKKELTAHFIKNYPQYDGLKQSVAVK